MTYGPSKLLTSGRLLFVIFGLAVLSGCDSPEERAQSHYKRGLELVNEGKPVKASLEFRNALKLKEGFVPALFELGKVERQQNRIQQAARIFARVVERAPEHLEARIHLSRILLLAGQLDESLKFADQAYALASTDLEVLVLKAAIALKLGNNADAVRFADAVLENQPDNVDALIVRAAERLAADDPKAALNYLQKGTERHDKNVGLQLFRMKSLASLKDEAGIENVFKKLIEYYPENTRFRYGLVQWYLRAGRKGDAETVMRKFAADSPDNIQAGLQLVRFLRREKGVEAAKEELRARVGGSAQVFAYRMALAELTFSQGKYEEATGLLKKLVSDSTKASEAARARVLLAQMMVSRQELVQADKQIEEVLKTDSTNVSALTVRASIRVARKQYNEAIEDLSIALNEEPESSSVLQLLAQVYELNGSTELARDHYANAARIEQFRPAVAMNFVRFLLRYGKSNQAERVLTEIRRVAPSNKEMLTLLARLRLARQDWLGAHEIADVLRKLEDNSGTAELVLAEALSGQEKHEESIKLLQAVVSDKNDQNSPIANLVRAYVRAGKSDSAEHFLQTVLTANPKNLQAQALLASLHELSNRKDEAEKVFKALVENNPNNATAHRALAEFYLRTKRLEDAETAVRSGIEQNDRHLTLRLLLALILEQTGRYDQAITEYEKMYQEEPRSTIVANNYASLLADHRDDEESIKKAYSIAVRFRDTDIPQFMDTLGWLHYRIGEYDQAVTRLRIAATKLPNESLVHYHLGMAYKELGRSALAIQSLKQAIDLYGEKDDPNKNRAQTALDELLSATKVEE